MPKLAARALVAVFLLIVCPFARAADHFAVQKLVAGLSNPCGIAIRPGESADRYEVFVSDSGAGRIIRVTSDAPQAAPVEVVTGFPLAKLGDDGIAVGPTGLLFLDRRRLVVGVSGVEGATVRLYELADNEAALSADSPKQQITLKTDRDSVRHVYSLARTQGNETVRDALVITCFDNEQWGQVRAIILRANMLTDLTLLTASRAEPQHNFPAAVAIGNGGYAVVGWTGSLRQQRDSRLAFYDPATGSQLMELSTELHDIFALAYSPRTDNLYAADAAWMEAKNGGIFRMDATDKPRASKCVAVKVVDIVRPSALAFGPDGALYVTALGEPNGSSSQGMLIKITGDL
jgi:hypothetical protein